MRILKSKELKIFQNHEIAKINKDNITKKLIDVFDKEVPEIGIIRLMHDNYHEFKPRNKQLNLILILFVIYQKK